LKFGGAVFKIEYSIPMVFFKGLSKAPSEKINASQIMPVPNTMFAPVSEEF
jgi:hypothetical protein